MSWQDIGCKELLKYTNELLLQAASAALDISWIPRLEIAAVETSQASKYGMAILNEGLSALVDAVDRNSALIGLKGQAENVLNASLELSNRLESELQKAEQHRNFRPILKDMGDVRRDLGHLSDNIVSECLCPNVAGTTEEMINRLVQRGCEAYTEPASMKYMDSKTYRGHEAATDVPKSSITEMLTPHGEHVPIADPNMVNTIGQATDMILDYYLNKLENCVCPEQS